MSNETRVDLGGGAYTLIGADVPELRIYREGEALRPATPMEVIGMMALRIDALEARLVEATLKDHEPTAEDVVEVDAMIERLRVAGVIELGGVATSLAQSIRDHVFMSRRLEQEAIIKERESNTRVHELRALLKLMRPTSRIVELVRAGADALLTIDRYAYASRARELTAWANAVSDSAELDAISRLIEKVFSDIDASRANGKSHGG